jgi:hypothetical protein
VQRLGQVLAAVAILPVAILLLPLSSPVDAHSDRAELSGVQRNLDAVRRLAPASSTRFKMAGSLASASVRDGVDHDGVVGDGGVVGGQSRLGGGFDDGVLQVHAGEPLDRLQ